MPVPKVKTRFSANNKANEETSNRSTNAEPSSSLPRPTLLGGTGASLPSMPSTTSGGGDDDASLFPPRPRRLWKVSDTRLNTIPAGYPPLDPRCCIYVADAPPSVVAVRIAEALRRQSVAVEYDEETPSATCWTADRCHFVIQLWQGPKNVHSVRTPDIPDLSAGILVEGMRLSGSVLTFHRLLRKILQAAISHDTGEDTRTVYQCHSLEFPRWKTDLGSQQKKKNTNTVLDLSSPDTSANQRLATTLEALEDAAALLEKDRHDAQTLGMERLVHLTDLHTVGVDVATIAAQSLLGVPPVEDPSALLLSIHKDWMMGLLLQRKLPNEKESSSAEAVDFTSAAAASPRASPSRLVCSKPGNLMHHAGGDTTTATGDDDNESARVEALLQQMRQERALTGDANHAGRLRSLLMRVWANALQVLHTYDPVALTTLLQHQTDITSRQVLNVLLEDVEGCSRPPLAAVMGTRLASPHESVWALVALRILAQHSMAARQNLEGTAYADKVLDKAVMVGSAVHDVLHHEATLAQTAWLEKR